MPLPAELDHLVLAARSLGEGCDFVERALGVRPAPGGRHPQWGTHNALLALGPRRYLEVLAPDPQAIDAAACARGAALFRLDRARDGGPRLTTWMVRAHPLRAAIESARALGIDLGAAHPGSRTRPDGSVLAWELAVPPEPPLGGVLPWPIDWQGSEHPAARAPAGCALEWIECSHPDPARAGAALAALGCPGIRIAAGAPEIRAGIACPRGVVVLS
jgi:hypothetical protein